MMGPYARDLGNKMAHGKTNSKRKFELLCHKLSSSLNYIKVRTDLHLFNLVLWFYFVILLKTGPNGLEHCNF